MDQQSYEQIALTADDVGDDANYLLENNDVNVLMHNGKPVSLSLPNFVELEVTETDPGVKGDTVTGGRKPATMSTGAVIQVPLFISTLTSLYSDEEGFHFMDQQSYEQIALTADDVGDDANYLLENNDVNVLMHNGKPVSLSLPNFVELEVTETDPGVKGDTVTGGRKPATMSTGAVIQVPLFIERGEKLKIDTRSGEYVERVK